MVPVVYFVIQRGIARVQTVIFVELRGTGARSDSKEFGFELTGMRILVSGLGFWGRGHGRSCLVVPARRENLTPDPNLVRSLGLSLTFGEHLGGGRASDSAGFLP